MKEPLIEVGRVAGSHGVSGKIRVTLFSGDPAGILRVSRVRLVADARSGEAAGGDGVEFELLTAQPLGGCAVLSLKGIASCEEAAPLAGARVLVRRGELPPPGEDEYYWADLVGCSLVDPEGGPLGRVTGLQEGPGHDWLVVRRPDGEESLLPFVAAFIRGVDLAERRISASPPEGW